MIMSKVQHPTTQECGGSSKQLQAVLAAGAGAVPKSIELLHSYAPAQNINKRKKD
jgi:hypothetical protein